jgi:hypothetical protein
MNGELSTAERLRIAAAMAPVERAAAHAGRSRPIKVVSAKAMQEGRIEVVGEVDSLAVTAKLRERVGIEFDIEPGKGRRRIQECIRCKKVFTMESESRRPQGGGAPSKHCRGCLAPACARCGVGLPNGRARQRIRDGHLAYCNTCSPLAAEIRRSQDWKKKPPPLCSACQKPIERSDPQSVRSMRARAAQGFAVFCDHCCDPKKTRRKKAEARTRSTSPRCV